MPKVVVVINKDGRPQLEQLWEVDMGIEGYCEPRHTYVVAAPSYDEAIAKAKRKWRDWLHSRAEATFVREAKIVH